MKSKLKKSLPYFVLGLLGFATACDDKADPPMYGITPPLPTVDAAISGTVTDTLGNPITDIEVQVFQQQTHTAADGSFSLTGKLPVKDYISFMDIDGADNGGEFAPQAKYFELTDADQNADGSYTLEGVDVQMQPATFEARIRGKVTDTEGNPILGILVQEPDANGGSKAVATTAADGSYILSDDTMSAETELVFMDIDGAANGGEFAQQSKMLDLRSETPNDDGSYTLEGIDVQMQEKQ